MSVFLVKARRVIIAGRSRRPTGFSVVLPAMTKERPFIPRRPPQHDIRVIPNIADLISGKIKGRTSDDQTSWVLSLGVMGVQFAAGYKAAVYNEAKSRHIGRENSHAMVYAINSRLKSHVSALPGSRYGECNLTDLGTGSRSEE
jgi:hypothetical protein